MSPHRKASLPEYTALEGEPMVCNNEFPREQIVG
jgi:hypothetical protein